MRLLDVLHNSSSTVSSRTTEIGRVQPVLEESGTNGPGSVMMPLNGVFVVEWRTLTTPSAQLK